MPRSIPPLHVAVIMDGNGRWARSRGLPRIMGHHEGAKAVRRVVEASPALGIGTLTLYAFSADNWQRPKSEVSALMQLLKTYLERETKRCIENGVRINVIGRRDRLAPGIVQRIEQAEAATAGGGALHLRVAIDYSARDAIAAAAQLVDPDQPPTQDEFQQLLNRVTHSYPCASEVDLLIRTSGEKRLSDFLLWECAYSELIFTDTRWPSFGEKELEAALAEFRSRDRRFGRVRAAS